MTLQLIGYRCILHRIKPLTTHDPHMFSKNLFLYLHLHHDQNNITKLSSEEETTTTGMTTSSSASRINRLFNKSVRFVEHWWHQASTSPSGTLKHEIFRLGTALINRIPVREWMLWRAHKLALAHDGKSIAYPLTITLDNPGKDSGFESLSTTTSSLNIEQFALISRQALIIQMSRAARYNQAWTWINSASLLPLTILTILPGVKLVWLWVAFRAVARYRAAYGARWLRETLQDVQKVRMVVNEREGSEDNDIKAMCLTDPCTDPEHLTAVRADQESFLQRAQSQGTY